MELSPPPKKGELEPHFDRVTKHWRNANGVSIGKTSDKPIFDTRMYKVEYEDGEKSSLSAKLISEKMFMQIDEEVNRHVLMDKITGPWFDEVVVKSQDAFVHTSSGTKLRR